MCDLFLINLRNRSQIFFFTFLLQVVRKFCCSYRPMYWKNENNVFQSFRNMLGTRLAMYFSCIPHALDVACSPYNIRTQKCLLSFRVNAIFSLFRITSTERGKYCLWCILLSRHASSQKKQSLYVVFDSFSKMLPLSAQSMGCVSRLIALEFAQYTMSGVNVLHPIGF